VGSLVASSVCIESLYNSGMLFASDRANMLASTKQL
jgi:hypothetical protein